MDRRTHLDLRNYTVFMSSSIRPFRLLTTASAVIAALAAFPTYGQESKGVLAPPEISQKITAMNSEAIPWISSERLEENRAGEEADALIAFAEEISGSPETEIVLKGDAELRRAGSTVKADRIIYKQYEDTARAIGNAEVSRSGVTFRSPEITYKMDSQSGEANDVEFEFAPTRLRGEAACVRFQSGDSTDMENSIVTTCRKGDDSWWIELDKLTIDEYDQTGVGRNAVLKIKGIPVAGVPWFTFPAGGKRQSGLLAPSLSISKSRGLDLAVPYYWNIAPNYDYTITPRIMTGAGVMLSNELRLLTKDFSAEIYGDYMPHDRSDDAPDSARWSVSGKLSGKTAGIGYGIDYTKVSDDNFTSDFGNSLRDSSDSVLTQDFWVNFSRKYIKGQISVRKNQTLNIDGKVYPKPYEKIPEVKLSGYAANIEGFEISTDLEATRFKHPTKREGDRFVFDQVVSYPLQGASWFVTPRAELISTWYNLDKALANNGEKHPGVTVPILSLDAGLTFERETTANGRATTQTLEPRIFYTYIPYKDQSDIPVFDSSLSDMNFAQLFTENSWSGYDRINEANHVTTALTTRFLDDETGAEWFRGAIGQRFYFNDYEINSAGRRVEHENRKSDFLASVGAKLFNNLTVTGFGQYNYDRKDFNRANFGIRWQPKPMSVVGLYYRYNHVDRPESDLNFKQIDLSAQWPITGRLYGLTRLNYSLLKKRWVEALAGFEYVADCWTVRLVGQRYITSEDKNEMRFFVQLELHGLGSVGSSPLETLREGIPGYQAQRRTIAPGRFGAFDYYQ